MLYHYHVKEGNSKAYHFLIGARRFDATVLNSHAGSIQVADLKRAL